MASRRAWPQRASFRPSGGKDSIFGGPANARTTISIPPISPTPIESCFGRATMPPPKPPRPRNTSAIIGSGRSCCFSRGDRRTIRTTRPPRNSRSISRPEQIQLRPNVPPQSQAAAHRDLAGYYAHGAALDECVGRIVATLHDTGLADNTILIFTADHGDMLGSHAQVRKQRPWDESILVPFLVRWPRGLPAGGRTLSAPFGTPDIMPTLLGLCGIKIPATVEGEDRSAWLRGESPDTDRRALICCVTPFGEWTRTQGGREFRGHPHEALHLRSHARRPLAALRQRRRSVSRAESNRQRETHGLASRSRRPIAHRR